ncbi:MAG: hypothetical protein V7719_02305 [Psychroserpens sp.]
MTNTNDVSIAEDIAPRKLCLPLYVALEQSDIERISGLILQAIS